MPRAEKRPVRHFVACGGVSGSLELSRVSDKTHLISQAPVIRGFFLERRVSEPRTEKTTEARLISLRWLSVVAMLAMSLASIWLVGAASLLARLSSIALVVGCANITLFLYTRTKRGRSETSPLLSPFAHLVFDLVAWTNFIFFSGGATNPLISVFLPLVAIGAMVLGRFQAWLFGGMAILAYSYLWFFHQPLAIADAYTATSLHIFGMWLVFVVSDVVLVWFILQISKAVRERDAALADSREQAIRNDWLVSMGSLAAGAAHELSTPLGTMNVVLDDLLDDETVPDSIRSDLALVQRQIEKCKRALAQLTDRASETRASNQRCTGALAWLERIIDEWVVLNPGTDVTRRLSLHLRDMKVINDLALERGVANFLDNAQHAGASGIRVEAEARDKGLRLSITDDGAGVSPVALESFRSGVPVPSEHGMGVGLLLARVAVERHGGSIEISAAEAGRGSRVTLWIPFEVAPAAGNGVVSC